jgi:GGDEF domain-containing protein
VVISVFKLRRHAAHDTARRVAEDALRDSERRHRLVLQHLPGTTVGLFDRVLRCRLLEGPHLERAGIDGEKMVGRMRDVGGVTVSVGVTPVGDEPSSSSALDRADMAMYAAKQAGRDRFEFAPAPLRAAA